MASTEFSFDVCVVGAGSAGSYAAWQLAEAGWKVVVIDRRPTGRGGAHWLNAIVPWQFERAGLAVPEGDELHRRNGNSHMFSPSGNHGVHLDNSPTWEIDMAKLCQRLWAGAEAAGVTFLWETHDPTLDFVGDRPASLTARRADETIRIHAKLFVDASGRAGVLRQAVPSMEQVWPQPTPNDMCAAQQYEYGIADVDGARAFLDTNGAAPGDTVGWLSETSGYGVRSITVNAELTEASVLVGTLATGGPMSARQLMKKTLTENPWIGSEHAGGAGLIPLRRPYSQLATAGVALVGDSAGQLTTLHGSGVGFGLIGAHLLAEATRGASDPGSELTLWSYQANFHREFGGMIAANDVIRRMGTRLGSDGVESLYALGLMSAFSTETALRQVFEPPPAGELFKRATVLLRNPRLALRIGPSLIRAAVAPVIYRLPTSPSRRRLHRWAKLENLIVGASS